MFVACAILWMFWSAKVAGLPFTSGVVQKKGKFVRTKWVNASQVFFIGIYLDIVIVFLQWQISLGAVAFGLKVPLLTWGTFLPSSPVLTFHAYGYNIMFLSGFSLCCALHNSSLLWFVLEYKDSAVPGFCSIWRVAGVCNSSTYLEIATTACRIWWVVLLGFEHFSHQNEGPVSLVVLLRLIERCCCNAHRLVDEAPTLAAVKGVFLEARAAHAHTVNNFKCIFFLLSCNGSWNSGATVHVVRLQWQVLESVMQSQACLSRDECGMHQRMHYPFCDLKRKRLRDSISKKSLLAFARLFVHGSLSLGSKCKPFTFCIDTPKRHFWCLLNS